MVTVYAISSKVKNYIYVGMCKDIDDRYNRHNAGYERTTKPYRPFDLIYTESFADWKKARVKEKYLKSGVGKNFLRSIRDNKNTER